jgi:tetrahydromethanopterin S-methyltransferase subunit G
MEKMDSRIDEMEVKLAILQRELPKRVGDSTN